MIEGGIVDCVVNSPLLNLNHLNTCIMSNCNIALEFSLVSNNQSAEQLVSLASMSIMRCSNGIYSTMKQEIQNLCFTLSISCLKLLDHQEIQHTKSVTFRVSDS